MTSKFTKKILFGALLASFLPFFPSIAFGADPISVTNYSAPGDAISISLTNTTGADIDLYYLSEGSASFLFAWFDVVSGTCVSHNTIPDENRQLTVPAGASCVVFPNYVEMGATHAQNVHTAITLSQLTGLGFTPYSFTRAYLVPPDSWSNFEAPVYFGATPPPSGITFTPAPWAPPILTPTYPPAGVDTVRADLDFYASGSISVATTSDKSWKKLSITFQKIESTGPGLETYTGSYTFTPSIAPGGSDSYSLDVSTLELPDGAYKVLYRIWADTSPLPYSVSYADDDTIIRNEALPIGWDTEESGAYPEPSLEDCSTLSVPNIWFCEIRNTVVGFIIPSQAKLGELRATVDQVYQRAPFNYINSAQTNFQLIVSSVSSSAISVTFFGHSGEINKDVLSQTGLTTLFQPFFALIFLALFLYWGINYIQRIF